MRSPDLLLRVRAPLLPLLAKELRDLVAGRAFWVMVLLLCPVVGFGFIQAVALYSEASRSAASFPELARGLSPFDGVLVPTFGAFYVATTLLFPFVAIRSIGAEKQNGGLKLLLQLLYGRRPSSRQSSSQCRLDGCLACCLACPRWSSGQPLADICMGRKR